MTRTALDGVDMSRRSTGNDRRGPGLHVWKNMIPTLVLQGGDLLEDVGQRLVLGSPVEQVVPVVAASDLLLAVDNAETKKEIETVVDDDKTRVVGFVP